MTLHARSPSTEPPGRRRTLTRAVLAPALFVVAWSSGAVAAPFGLAEVSPQAFLAIRATGCAVIGWGIWGFVRDALPTSPRAWTHVTGVGLLMQVTYQGCFFIALDRGISAGLLALIVSAQPLLTAVTARAHDIRVWAALALGTAGVALAVGADLHASSNTAGGIVAAVGALGAITVGTIAQARSNTAFGLWAGLAIQSTFSALVFTATLTVTGLGRWHPGVAFAGSAAWMICVVSIGATALLYAMVRSGNEIAVTSLFFTVPAVTAVLDYVVNGTLIPASAVFGFTLTISALIAISRHTAGHVGGAPPDTSASATAGSTPAAPTSATTNPSHAGHHDLPDQRVCQTDTKTKGRQSRTRSIPGPITKSRHSP